MTLESAIFWLSALDFYWAAIAALLEPLPEDLCPLPTRRSNPSLLPLVQCMMGLTHRPKADGWAEAELRGRGRAGQLRRVARGRGGILVGAGVALLIVAAGALPAGAERGAALAFLAPSSGRDTPSQPLSSSPLLQLSARPSRALPLSGLPASPGERWLARVAEDPDLWGLWLEGEPSDRATSGGRHEPPANLGRRHVVRPAFACFSAPGSGFVNIA